ncbi:MAG: hypothetical protein SPK85_00775 [Prevotella sp.]|nr:hypothetical protein [Prevotella sp.]MBQ2060374.1 hypothetical protein [Prevotella sp.]MBQ2339132.1 hypothetical protein [Prevotella sp.]MDY6437632.1 hypothetical protein [Prevotella sp.]
MKATYKHPQIKKITTETESLMGPGASSVTPPTVGARQSTLYDDSDEPDNSLALPRISSVWDE